MIDEKSASVSNADQRKMTLGIVGGGRGGLEMLKLLADSELVAVAYMVDQDPRAIGMVEAKARSIATHTDLVATMKRHRTDFIIEATGSAKVTEIITQNLTGETELISSKASLMLFTVLNESRKKANQTVFEEISTLSEEISQNAMAVQNALADITQVAFDLKVLAINAAIEAARAGDSGRAFSVVADAVKGTANEAREMVERVESVNNNNVLMSKKLEALLDKLH